MTEQLEESLPDFIDMGKIPDLVRDIPVFEGKSTELINWLIDVQEVFSRYRDLSPQSDQYKLIERTVRRKIKGEASDVLNANNVSASWNEIKNVLLLYYKDKRELKTLDFELTAIKKQPTETLSSYYSRVNELLSCIIAQLQTDANYANHAPIHTNYFREKALDCFIRGLEKPLCFQVKMANPNNLSKAYHLCLEFQNMELRSAPFRNEHSVGPPPKPKELEPRIPARRPIPAYQPNYQSFHPPAYQPNQPSFYPPAYQPNQQGFYPFQFARIMNPHPSNSNPFHVPPRNLKPPPTPEPMEVDPSMRTQYLNYGNRPTMTQTKRPHPSPNQFYNFKKQAHPLECPWEYSFDPNQCYSYEDYHNHAQAINYEYEDTGESSQKPDPNMTTPPTKEAAPQSQEENAPVPKANFLEWQPS